MFLELLIMGSAIYLGFNIGANDTANTMGACVGGGALGLRKAITLAAMFVFIGGILGTEVTETIAVGIMPPADLSQILVMVSLFASGSFVALATIRGLPVSTSHALVMSLVGVGLGMGSELNLSQLLKLASAWVIFPLATIPLAFMVIRLIKPLLSRIESLVELEITLKYLLIFSSIYASFALGASHAGLVGGMLEASGLADRTLATLVGSLSISLGVLLLSKRVIQTVGQGVTALSPVPAFAMQLSMAIGLTICSLLGYPVSSSQGIVSAAVGVGLAQGQSRVNRRKITQIILAWALVPSGALIVTFSLVRVFLT